MAPYLHGDLTNSRGGLFLVKSKVAALLLCFFLWWLGIHEFYLGNTGGGLAYLICFLIFGVFLGWLIIPAIIFIVVGGIVALIEFLMLLFMPSEEFDRKFNRVP